MAADEDALAWIAFVLLAVVAAIGFSMLFIWLRQRSKEPAGPVAGQPAETIPAERSFPVPIVAGHGLLAAVTLVLVLLTAAGVGD